MGEGLDGEEIAGLARERGRNRVAFCPRHLFGDIRASPGSGDRVKSLVNRWAASSSPKLMVGLLKNAGSGSRQPLRVRAAGTAGKGLGRDAGSPALSTVSAYVLRILES